MWEPPEGRLDAGSTRASDDPWKEGQDVVTDLNQLQPLLSTADVAEYLGVPVKTLYAWRYRHEGPPALRVGRHVRYRRLDIEEWVRSRVDPPGRP